MYINKVEENVMNQGTLLTDLHSVNDKGGLVGDLSIWKNVKQR